MALDPVTLSFIAKGAVALGSTIGSAFQKSNVNRLKGDAKRLSNQFIDSAKKRLAKNQMDKLREQLIEDIITYLDEVKVEEPSTAFEEKSIPKEEWDPELTEERIRIYESALEALIAGQWEMSRKLLDQMPKTDRPTLYLKRYLSAQQYTPPADWDGAIRLKSK